MYAALGAAVVLLAAFVLFGIGYLFKTAIEREQIGHKAACAPNCDQATQFQIDECWLKAKNFGAATTPLPSPDHALAFYSRCLAAANIKNNSCIAGNDDGCVFFDAISLHRHHRGR